MNKVIIFWVIISIAASGCASGYRFKYKTYNEDQEKGYIVSKGEYVLPELTQDTQGKYPGKLKVAKERFKRRRKTVEKCYKEMIPEMSESLFSLGLKNFIFLSFLPISLIILNIIERQPEKEVESAIEAHKRCKEELQKYIEEDCKKESK